MHRRTAFAAFTTLLFLSLPALADAAPKGWVFKNNDKHNFEIAVLGSFNPPVLGGTVYAGIPVAPMGFGKGINDAFFIDVGAFFGGIPPNGLLSNYFGVAPYGGVRYELYLFDWLAVSANVRGGAFLAVADPNFGFRVTPWINGGLGIDFTISKNIYIRLQAGYPLHAGVAFVF